MSIAGDIYRDCTSTEQAFRVSRVVAIEMSYCNGLLKAVFKDSSIMMFDQVSCRGYSFVDVEAPKTKINNSLIESV